MRPTPPAPGAWAPAWPVGTPPAWAGFLVGTSRPLRVTLVALAGLGLPLLLMASHAPALAVVASFGLMAAAVAAIATTDGLTDDGLVRAKRGELANAAAVHGVGAAGAVVLVVAVVLAALIAIVVIGALLAAAAHAGDD